MVLLTQNIAETFKAFGESFVLHQFVFERQIMYKSNESYFWAHVRSLFYKYHILTMYYYVTTFKYQL